MLFFASVLCITAALKGSNPTFAIFRKSLALESTSDPPKLVTGHRSYNFGICQSCELPMFRCGRDFVSARIAMCAILCELSDQVMNPIITLPFPGHAW